MRILIAGDFSQNPPRIEKQIDENNFSEIFSNKLIDIIKSVDYSLVNFERSVTQKDCKPIIKCGPNLSCTTNAVDALRYAGFSAVTMANNHILDFGKEGLNKTIECCKKNGIDIVGVGNNLEEAKKILYVEKKGENGDWGERGGVQVGIGGD